VPCEAEAPDVTTSRERASHFRNEDALSSAVRKKSATRAALLNAPIVSTMAKLALPTIAVLAAQTTDQSAPLSVTIRGIAARLRRRLPQRCPASLLGTGPAHRGGCGTSESQLLSP
jgi:hypothetical protein